MNRLIRSSASGVIAATVCLVYWQTWHFEFISLDDGDYVFLNPQVLQGLTLDAWKWAWGTVGYSANWHPLTWLSLMADVEFFGGKNVGAMHLHNMALHVANAVLLFWLILAILKNIRGGLEPGSAVGTQAESVWRAVLPCFFAAVLWAVHPLRVEVVAWVSERKELLSVFWGLAACCLYLHGSVSGKGTGRLLYGLSVLCYGLSLTAKPVTVGLPAILIAFEFACVRRPRWWRVTPFMLLALAGCMVTVAAQQEAMAPVREVVLSTRLMNAVTALGVYLRQAVLPYGLGVFYPVSTEIKWGVFSAGVLVLLGSAACGVRMLIYVLKNHCDAPASSDRFGIYAIIVAWCLVGLLPMLGIVQVGSQAHADRYTYWAGCGFSVALAYGASQLLGWTERRRFFVRALYPCVFAGLLALYAILAWRQAGAWENTLKLFSHSYETGDKNAWAAFALAQQYSAINPVKAEALYRVSIEKSQNSENLGGLAIFLAMRSEDSTLDEPFALAQRALTFDKDSVSGHEAMGVIAFRRQVWAKAEEHLTHAVKAKNANPATLEWLAMAQLNQKEYRAGYETYKRIAERLPGDMRIREEVRKAYALALQAGELRSKE
jgi:hypothetical protein